jgi:hypothetical protein
VQPWPAWRSDREFFVAYYGMDATGQQRFGELSGRGFRISWIKLRCLAQAAALLEQRAQRPIGTRMRAPEHAPKVRP